MKVSSPSGFAESADLKMCIANLYFPHSFSVCNILKNIACPRRWENWGPLCGCFLKIKIYLPTPVAEQLGRDFILLISYFTHKNLFSGSGTGPLNPYTDNSCIHIALGRCQDLFLDAFMGQGNHRHTRSQLWDLEKLSSLILYSHNWKWNS